MTTWFRRVMAGLRGLARRQRDDRELDDEVQQYLEASIAAKIAAGLSEQEAIRAARAELGSRAAIEDYVHDVGWETHLLSIWDDVRYAARGLWASRGFTLAVVITLGLGIGVNTAMFSMLDVVLLRKLPVSDAHELVGLYENAPRVTPDIVSGTDRYTRFSYPRFLRLQRALGTHGALAAMTATNGFPARLHNGQRIAVSVQLVSGNYFETFRILPARGRMLSASDVATGSPPVAVVSDSFWKRQMGSRDDAVGQRIEIGGAAAMVVGVAPAAFNGVWMDDAVDVWLPLTLQPAIPYRGNFYGSVDQAQPFVQQDRVAWLTLVGRISRRDRRLAQTALESENRLGITEFAMSVTTNADERTSDGDPMVYLPYDAQAGEQWAVLVRAAREPDAVVPLVREEVRALDPDLPLFDIKTLDERLAFLRWPERVFGTMFTIFACIGLIMAAVGLYAMTAYSVKQRTQEIGIRMALGARAPHVWWLVLRRATVQLVIGLTVGLPGALIVGRLPWMDSADPLILISIVLAALIVTGVASFLPAHRATHVDPLGALRYE
jgi:hypothetical protein